MDASPNTMPLALEEERLIWREVDDQVIVLDKRSWGYLSINDSGALLWKQIAGGATHAELVARLQGDYGLDEATAARDVESFVSKMREHGLLQADGDPR